MTQQGQDSPALTSVDKVIATFYVALVTASLMWSSEAAIRGDGLHLAMLWILLAALTLFSRSNRGVACSGSRMALVAVGLMVAGFWLSTWNVFRIHGDRRAALNLAFEWSALLSAWWVTRQVWIMDGRRFIGRLLLSLIIGTAVQGVWQHHGIYPSTAEWYSSKRSALDDAISAGIGGAIERKELESEFQQMNVPLAGPQRELFEHRLLHSTEPVGPFALANSLGGILCVSIILLFSAILPTLNTHRRSAVGFRLLFAATLLIVAYCLLLTKSRTAWLGTAVGCVAFLLHSRTEGLWVQVRRVGPIVLSVVAISLGLGIGTGAMDKEVLLESPRSIQFRLLYWMGSAGVIADSPVFGSGPGNFRQAYLTHKYDEASEEILDPHNFLMDAWASAGLVTFAGAALLFWSAWTVYRRQLAVNVSDEMRVGQSSSNSGNREHSEPTPSQELGSQTEQKNIPHRQTFSQKHFLSLSILFGALLHFVWDWLSGGSFDFQLSSLLQWRNGLLLMPSAAIVTCALIRNRIQLTRRVALCCFSGLAVHLMAAGGLQISGVMLMLLVLHAIGTAGAGTVESDTARKPSSIIVNARRALSVVLVVIAFFVATRGVLPTYKSQQLRMLATQQRSIGDPTAAKRTLMTAIDVDPLGVESSQQLVELLTYEIMGYVEMIRVDNPTSASLPPEGMRLYDEFVAVTDRHLRLDSRSWSVYRNRGMVKSRLMSFFDDPQHRQSTISDLQMAMRIYPGNPQLCAEVADVWEVVGERSLAKEAASRALKLQRINEQWSHFDRLLDDEVLSRMKLIETLED